MLNFLPLLQTVHTPWIKRKLLMSSQSGWNAMGDVSHTYFLHSLEDKMNAFVPTVSSYCLFVETSIHNGEWRDTALGTSLALCDANNLACRRLAQLLVQSNEHSQIRASRWISWEVEKARLLVALKPQVLLPYWLPLMLPMPELQALPLQMSLILLDQRAASETA